MSLYPAAAAGQGLYAASTTPKAKPGTRMSFETDLGIVEAIYVENNNAASIPAGYAVGHPWDNDANPYAVDTAAINNASAARVQLVGVLCASMQGTATSLGGKGYAWCAFRGPITCAQLAANAASNSLLFVSANSAGLLATIATSVPTAASILAPERYVGALGATASTLSRASDTPVAGHYVNLFWK